MAEIDSWSATASDNDQTSPEGAPEGWTGKEINGSIRENMAKIYRWYRDTEWVDVLEDLPARGPKTLAQNTTTQLQINSCDARAYYPVGRRIRTVGATTEEAHVAAVAFTAGHTLVDVTLGVIPSVPTKSQVYFGKSLTRGAFGESGVNDVPFQIDDSSATPQDVARITGSDVLLIGDQDIPTTLQTDGADSLSVDYPASGGAKKVLHEGNAPFAKVYESAELTVADNDSHTLDPSAALGASVQPLLILLWLRCKTDDDGWVAGDELIVSGTNRDDNGGLREDSGVQSAWVAASSSIRVDIGDDGLRIINGDTQGTRLIDPANWKLIVRAYA